MLKSQEQEEKDRLGKFGQVNVGQGQKKLKNGEENGTSVASNHAKAFFTLSVMV